MKEEIAITPLSQTDEDILEMLRKLVNDIDMDTKHYLYKILSGYKVNIDDKTILLRLNELKELIDNKQLDLAPVEGEEEKTLYINIGQNWINIKNLSIFSDSKHYDSKLNQVVYDILLRGKIISYMTEEQRDRDMEKIKINLELFNNSKFIN